MFSVVGGGRCLVAAAEAGPEREKPLSRHDEKYASLTDDAAAAAVTAAGAITAMPINAICSISIHLQDFDFPEIRDLHVIG